MRTVEFLCTVVIAADSEWARAKESRLSETVRRLEEHQWLYFTYASKDDLGDWVVLEIGAFVAGKVYGGI